VRVDEAEALQRELAGRVTVPTGFVPAPTLVAGLDVSYAVGSDRIAAAAVVVEAGTLIDQSVVTGVVDFPYVPGLLAFREVPALLSALEGLRVTPEVLLCDGQGIAHPRRCGLACHLGVLTGIAAIGCAKTRFVGDDVEPGQQRGDRVALRDKGELVGYGLRTQDRVRPVYVSPGHSIGFDQSCEIVLAACSAYRLPDPIRHADHLSRQALKGSNP
jgi:deoxyribonuclease V